MCYRFLLYVSADLHKLALQPGIQQTLRDHGYGQTHNAICPFTPQLSPGTHSSLTTEDRLRLSRPGCLVLHQGGLPVQRQSPTRH